jgi:phage major head subunit gpT-like protein
MNLNIILCADNTDNEVFLAITTHTVGRVFYLNLQTGDYGLDLRSEVGYVWWKDEDTCRTLYTAS